jgi:lysine-arginine-ornithine-binding protein
MRSFSFTLAAVALAVLPLAGQAQSDTIRFGIDPTFRPYEYRLADGSLTGFEVDLGTEICKRLNAKCVWVQQPFDSIIPALKAKKFDAILSGLTATPKRREQVDFTDRLFSGIGALVAKCGTDIHSTPESLRGKRIGVGLGSSQEAYAKTHWAPKGVELVPYPNMEGVRADLVAGRVDVSFESAAPAQIGFLDQPQGKGFCMVGEKITDKDLLGDGIGIGLEKGNDALRTKLNEAISAIRKDGTYMTIAKKYFDYDPYGE